MAGSNHGHTPAAWTGVTIAFIGFCTAGAFTVMASPVGFWAGVALTLLGGVVGWVMSAMGLGQPEDIHTVPQPTPPTQAPATREPVTAES